MQQFRGGLVFRAHRLCVSLNSRLELFFAQDSRVLLRNLILRESGSKAVTRLHLIHLDLAQQMRIPNFHPSGAADVDPEPPSIWRSRCGSRTSKLYTLDRNPQPSTLNPQLQILNPPKVETTIVDRLCIRTPQLLNIEKVETEA